MKSHIENSPSSVLIKKDVTAPIFSLQDVYGRLIDLNAYKDKRVLVAFFRHAGCPFCNLRVHALLKEHEYLKSIGLEMIFFFESKASVILRSSFHQDISPIPIISDPEKNGTIPMAWKPLGTNRLLATLLHLCRLPLKLR